jgi:cellulose synthase/poly-beta-1,6-N-acetylglucosamine synthase-like glycosyltransferase
MQFYQDIMSQKEKKWYLFLLTIWLASVVVFFGWWFNPEHVVSGFGTFLNTIIIGWSTLLPAYYFALLWRMKRPNPELPVPSGRVAMVVTKVPSESFEMVTGTLTAVLAQSHAHDTWLADEDPTDEMIAWCEDHKVLVSCRKGISEYHRTSWPRRAKTKEGNLAYFYDQYGYERYDYVVQMDADHYPEPGYLENMLRPFNDPKIGYVAAPSICDRNTHESWVAMARVDAEATLHGALQAGCNDGLAPMCIGSHYAVRTCALKSIGGLGPELAEDHSTTLLMNAGGWRGAFAFDAIAHGYGAYGFYDAITQEFQWARSLMAIFYELTPKCLGKLSPRLKLQFLFSQLWYPLTGLAMLASYVLPVMAVAGNAPLINVDYLDFVLHFLPTSASCLAIVLWVQSSGWTRPAKSHVLTWKVVLFQLVRWPWILLGCLDATVSFIGNKTTSRFRVTPKGGRRPLPYGTLFSYLLVSVISGTVVCLGSHGASILGYYYLLAFNCIVYLTVTMTVIVLHFGEDLKVRPLDMISIVAAPAYQAGRNWLSDNLPKGDRRLGPNAVIPGEYFKKTLTDILKAGLSSAPPSSS